MACATLKRPLDWDPHNTPTSSALSGSPRSAPSSSYRPAKRRCMFISPHVSPPKQRSAFDDCHEKISQAFDIHATLKDETQKLHNRKQLNFSSTCPSGNNPATSSSQLDLTSSELSSSSSSNYNNVGLLSPSRRDQPLFTYRQVGLIVEKLLKERELLIREEYEQVLRSKLAEQYDTFVKFTYDQIQKSFDVGGTPSYLS